MADKILNDYQGESIRINGVCYGYGGETTTIPNTDPSEIQGSYASCLACAIDSSSDSSSSETVYITLGNEGTENVGTPDEVGIAFTGTAGQTATVIVNGVSFTVANDSGDFVWDQGGVDPHTFVSPGDIGDSISRTADGFDFVVTYDGTGSLLFRLTGVNVSSSSSTSGGISSSSQSESSSSQSESSSSSEGISPSTQSPSTQSESSSSSDDYSESSSSEPVADSESSSSEDGNPTSYTVSGSSVSPVNGVYDYEGQTGGKDYFKHVTYEIYMYWYNPGLLSDRKWYIAADIGLPGTADDYYKTVGDTQSDTPLLTGWEKGKHGTAGDDITLAVT